MAATSPEFVFGCLPFATAVTGLVDDFGAGGKLTDHIIASSAEGNDARARDDVYLNASRPGVCLLPLVPCSYVTARHTPTLIAQHSPVSSQSYIK